MAIAVGKDRILRLSLEERLKKQEVYNIDEYDLLPASFKNSPDRKLYKNFNFSIFIDDYCNARCPFCVAELRYENRHLDYKKKKLFANNDEYLRRLEEVIKIIRPYNPSVSITGGEPTISPRLPAVARLLKEYDFRKKVVTSNGTGFFRSMPGESQSNGETIVECGFDHVNISRAAYDEIENQKLMKYKGKGTDLELLERIVKFLKPTGTSLRLSCILAKNGVNSKDRIIDYVENFNTLDVDNFIFRELMTSDMGAINQDVINWCNEERVHLEPIWEEFDKDKFFTPKASILGYYYYVEVWNYLNSVITTESSNLQQQYVEKEAHEDVVYEMVFHENGNLTASWVDDEDILDEFVGE